MCPPTGRVDLLSLNAGIGLELSWEDVAYFHKIMDVNLFGVINGISTFLPVVQAQKAPSAIIITSSKQGITNSPGNRSWGKRCKLISDYLRISHT